MFKKIINKIKKKLYPHDIFYCDRPEPELRDICDVLYGSEFIEHVKKITKEANK